MSIPPEKVAEFRISQLEMVQNAIARIAGYGATIKNWCITVATGVCGFSITIQRPALVWLALLPILTFAIMDAQYLRVERQFRNTFDRIRLENWDAPPSFDIHPDAETRISLAAILCSWSIANFYLPLALGVAAVRFIELLG
jgi:hypothetical protein